MEVSEYYMVLLGVLNIVLIAVVIRLATQQRQRSLSYERKLKLLNDDVSALCSGAAGMAGHLNKVEQKVKRVMERQDQLDSREPSDRALDQASRMVRQGATVEELIATCGLVRAEAELLMLLHRPQNEDDSPLRVVSG
ncbi:hypothetical protein MNBD_GAMMA17-1510 [hydrothermal vent metagenome]|uniref:DUF2802 domain-containing protein n=1 Tax=hydrothermal vent metagenome TaxID=652676 RepID=A0A3B0ZD85_9ZZZZ